MQLPLSSLEQALALLAATQLGSKLVGSMRTLVDAQTARDQAPGPSDRTLRSDRCSRAP